MKDIIKSKQFKRKPLESLNCDFYDYHWNDSEQRNYIIKVCNNDKNEGESENIADYFHSSHEYSDHYKNTKMPYRCWDEDNKIAKCPMALTDTEPEVECSLFVPEKARPTKALVTKEEIKERFYQPTGICMACKNCIS